MSGNYNGQDFEIAMSRTQGYLCALAMACTLNQFVDTPRGYPTSPSNGIGIELIETVPGKKAALYGLSNLVAFSTPGYGYDTAPVYTPSPSFVHTPSPAPAYTYDYTYTPSPYTTFDSPSPYYSSSSYSGTYGLAFLEEDMDDDSEVDVGQMVAMRHASCKAEEAANALGEENAK